jgi:cell division protein FtsA
MDSEKKVNFVCMDVGSSKIATIASFIDKHSDAEILSHNIHYSSGIRSSIITDLIQAQNSILQAVTDIEHDCNNTVNEAIISLSGFGTKSFFLESNIKISNRKVSPEDVEKLIEKTVSNFKIPEYSIIHYFPLEFILDDNNIVTNPSGMFCDELSCKLHIIAVNSNILKNLANCLMKCKIEVAGVVLGIYASSIACLTDDEKQLGSIAIDLGANTSAFALFSSGKMIYSGHIPIGGWHITSDIAKAFSLNFNTAEKLKILYGSANHFNQKNTNISIDDEDGNEVHITTEELSSIILPRVLEIIEMIKTQYDKIDLDHIISKKVVLTGGGASLKGIREVVSNIFSKQTRIAKPKHFKGFTEDYNPGVYSSAIGLLETYINHRKKKHSLSILQNNNSIIKKIINWVKENI